MIFLFRTMFSLYAWAMVLFIGFDFSAFTQNQLLGEVCQPLYY